MLPTGNARFWGWSAPQPRPSIRHGKSIYGTNIAKYFPHIFQSTPRRPNLLTIPQELRDEIYTLAITSSLPVPPDTSYGTREQISKAIHAKSGFIAQCSLTPLQIASNSLLLTNQQINTEVSGWLTRYRRAHPLAYSLDCVTLNERHVFLTWLSIPYLSRSIIGTLYVNLRIEGPCEDSFRASIWCGGVGGPGTPGNEMAHSLWRLLYHFLVRGPCCVGSGLSSYDLRPQTKRFNVAETLINVTNWSMGRLERDEPEVEWVSCNFKRRRGRGRPDYVAHELLSLLEIVAAANDSTARGFLAEIDGHVGTIKVLLDDGLEIGSVKFPSNRV